MFTRRTVHQCTAQAAAHLVVFSEASERCVRRRCRPAWRRARAHTLPDHLSNQGALLTTSDIVFKTKLHMSGIL